MLKCEKKLCTGCTACINICPKDAITIECDSNGSVYPKLDETKCIDCNLCNKVCSYKNIKENNEKHFYVAYNKNLETRMKSSSGGMFNELCKYIIDNNGIVFGCAINGSNVFHTYVDNIEDCKKFYGAKYVDSILGDSYLKVKDFLEKGKLVLFSGTPCQVNGLKLFLRKEYSNLLTVDFICHGTPVKKVFQKYTKELEEKYNSKIKNFYFRDKTYGWKQYSYKIEFENGKSIIEPAYKNLYSKIFLSNIALKESCYNCSSNGDKRLSDITIADFWGVENKFKDYDDNKGTSLLVINSSIGNNVFNNIKSNIKFKEVSREDAVQYNSSYYQTTKKHKNRDNFFDNIDNYNLDKLSKKYIESNIFKKIIIKFKNLVLKLLRKIKNIFKK